MGQNVAQKLIGSHLADGEMTAGSEIGLRIDQTLTQDATGTMVMLELEALGLDRVRTQASVQYVDHNLLQADERNMADHLFLRSACQRFGVWYSRPGNGVSHPVHMQRFGRPGASLAGSDSHTCAAGSLGMLAIGVGGLEVAMAMAGEPLYVTMPEIWGVRLTGTLPPWVSAKDVILEMLRRHGVKGGVGRIIEYHGPGLGSLSAMDRHVIANMGAELGATTSVFPADEQVRAFLDAEGRGDDFAEMTADPDASYDVTEEIDLGEPGAADRQAELARQRRAGPRGGGRARPPGGGRFLGQPWAARLRDAGRDHRRPPGPPAGVHGRQPHLAADPRRPDRHGRDAQPDQVRGADPPGRLHGVHRHGAGTRDRPQQPADGAAQLPRPIRHGRGLGLAVLAGNSRGRRPDRRDHRSSRPAVATRHRVPGPGPFESAVAARRRRHAAGSPAG